MKRIFLAGCFVLILFTGLQKPAKSPQNFTNTPVTVHCPDSLSAIFSPQIIVSSSMLAGKSYPVKISVPDSIDLAEYRVSWKASSGQILPDTNSRDITFTPSQDPNTKGVVIYLVLTNECLHQYLATYFITVTHCTQAGVIPDIDIPANLSDEQKYTAAAIVPAGTDLASYTMKWTVSEGRIEGSAAASQITFYPPIQKQVTTASITLTLTNSCGEIFVGRKDVQISHTAANEGIVNPAKLISPNNDGMGYDFLYLENIELYPQNEVTVYNRWGNVIYKKRGYDNDKVKFTGKNMADQEVTDGVFYYIVKISASNLPRGSAYLKGYFILKR